MLLLFSNNAQTTLAGPIASNATSLNVAAGTGSEFPSPTSGLQYFVVTLNDQATKLVREIVWVTARSGDTFTILRAQEGTTARAWAANDVVANWWTAGQAAAMIQVAQLQAQQTNYAVDSGAANTITVTLNPQPASLASIAGAPIKVLVAHTNTGNTVLNIAGLASTTVFAQGGASTSSLPAGSILGGLVYEFTYNTGLGFEVQTVKAILSTANTWALTQSLLNNEWWSALNTSGTPQALIGVDTSNNATLVAGPTGSQAWRVLTSSLATALLYMSSTGGLHAVGGIVADTGGITSTNGTVTGVGVAAGTSGITTTAGSTGTNDQHRVPALSDFASANSSASNGWTIVPSFGLGSGNQEFIVQFGAVSVAGAPTLNTIVSLPRAFPNNFAMILISYGSNVPPNTGAVGAQPASLSTFSVTNTSPNPSPNGCYFIAFGW